MRSEQEMLSETLLELLLLLSVFGGLNFTTSFPPRYKQYTTEGADPAQFCYDSYINARCNGATHRVGSGRWVHRSIVDLDGQVHEIS